MAGTDIYNIETGSPIYNGSVVMNIGAQGKDYFEYFRGRAITTPVIADIENLYSGDMDELTYYQAGS